MPRTYKQEEPKLKFVISDTGANAQFPNRVHMILFKNKVGIDNITAIGPFTLEELKELRLLLKQYVLEKTKKK